jgi:uncharacterized phage-associated protein
MMTNFDKRKLTEMVLYILNKTNGLDYYHVFKIIYFANISSLAKYGLRITTDDFCALPDGPAPSILYDSIKNGIYLDKDLEQMIDQAIVKGNDDAYYMWSAKRQANLDYLSKSEIEELDKSIAENAYLPYNTIKAKSHGEEWNRAFYSNNPGRKIMDVVGMAKDASAPESVIDYIREELEIERALA